MEKKPCIVLFSGGQDSTTCLMWATKIFGKVIALGFDYGQKHRQELDQAKQIADLLGVTFNVIDVKGSLGGSSLTDHSKNHNADSNIIEGVPASFTPGRNALFLTIAAGIGAATGIKDIVTGVCQTDYSGYPDCRMVFIQAMQMALSLGIYGKSTEIEIHAPLMYLSKAETWKLAKDLGPVRGSWDPVQLIIDLTMTDYNGDMTTNEWGRGKLNNPASELRAKGYYEAKEKGWI